MTRRYVDRFATAPEIGDEETGSGNATDSARPFHVAIKAYYESVCYIAANLLIKFFVVVYI